MTVWEKAGLTLMLGANFSVSAYILDPNPNIPKSTALALTLGVSLIGCLIFSVSGNQGGQEESHVR